MAKGICYSIDTSALINWWVEDYSPDVFPSLLAKMEDLIAQGRLQAARSVKDEVGEGELREWCLAQHDFFVDEDEEIQKRVAGLMAAYQNPKKAARDRWGRSVRDCSRGYEWLACCVSGAWREPSE